MGKLVAILVLLAALLIGYVVNKHYNKSPKLPPLVDEYYGAGKKVADNTKIESFLIDVPNSTLEDLQTRLKRARFFDPLEDVAFNYGFSTTYLKKIQQYWRDTFDWRKQEAYLNQYPHFKTEIEGLKVHFVHIKPDKSKYIDRIRPLIIIHGWPGSIYEFYKVLPYYCCLCLLPCNIGAI